MTGLILVALVVVAFFLGLKIGGTNERIRRELARGNVIDLTPPPLEPESKPIDFSIIDRLPAATRRHK